MELYVKQAERADLPELLRLYTYLHDNHFPVVDERLTEIWSRIMNDANHYIFLGCTGGRLVSSCVLAVIENLTHGQRPYGVVENVITHPDHRGNGYASRVLAVAKDTAVKRGCYKLMLMTGSKKESTLNFYRRAGYNAEDKTAFVQWL